VLADRHDQTTLGQFVSVQVNLASSANAHGRNPYESDLGHVVLEPLTTYVDPVTS
jgi:hypothetical protein